MKVTVLKDYQNQTERETDCQSNRTAFPQVDLYIPAGLETEQATLPINVLVFTHGGAWITGNKSDFEFLGLEMASRGLVTCILGYRLAEKSADDTLQTPKNCFPAAYLDVAAGIEWVYKNISSILHPQLDLPVDEKSRSVSLVLCGHSAGTHLNGLVVLKDMNGEKYNLSREAKSAVICLISVEGIYDLTSLAQSFPTYSDWFLNTAFPQSVSTESSHLPYQVPPWSPDLSLCAAKDLDVDLVRQLSFFCIYSEADELVDARQATEFVNFLKSDMHDVGMGVADKIDVVFDFKSIVDSHDGVLKNPVFFDLLFLKATSYHGRD